MYYYRQQIKGKFTDVEQLLVAALKDNGFGIITEIDVQKTLKEKMGVETAPHKILGACNPSYTHTTNIFAGSLFMLLGLFFFFNGTIWLTSMFPGGIDWVYSMEDKLQTWVVQR